MKIDRLISIIMILLDKKRIGAEELSQTFEVSKRTIYRDIEAINLAGIPVRSTPGVDGGFEIMQKYKVDKNVFSTADLSAILTGLSGLSGMMKSDELANALAKVKSFIPADKAKDIELKADQICIDLSPWIGYGNIRPYLDTIKTALHESRLLSFDYTDRFGNKTERTAEPYQLVLKGSHWYWQGYCHERNDFRLFKLSRISNLRLRNVTFTPRDFPKPLLEFDEIFATMRSKIKIRIHASAMDKVLEYCAHEDVSPDGDDHYLACFPFMETDYYYNILLGLGDGCECVEPEHVRTEMKRRLRAIAAIYED